jgi:predicted acylesterase/phospholipase RssA
MDNSDKSQDIISILSPLIAGSMALEPPLITDSITLKSQASILDKPISNEQNNPKVYKIVKTNLVLSGGGIKGVAHIGALYAMQELGILTNFTSFTATSVGSLLISLYVVGYSPCELYDFIKHFDLARLKNINLGNIDNYGLDDGKRVEFMIRRMIRNKGLNENITLKELYDLTLKYVIFTSVCITKPKVHFLSKDTFPDLPLYKAVRMSISIPFFYCPVEHEGEMYVDGGLGANYPMEYYNGSHDKTIGLHIMDPIDNIDKIQDLETYGLRILEILAHFWSVDSTKKFLDNTININVASINIINYSIDSKVKDELFMSGYKSVMDNRDVI